ncbi:MAG: LUD domain-containing protein, partial [Bacteroidota bacterium]
KFSGMVPPKPIIMSREKILAAIRQHKPNAKAAPEIPAFDRTGQDVMALFQKVAESSGMKVYQGKLDPNSLNELFPHCPNILSRLPEITSTVSENDLLAIDLAILPAQLVVAENAALWLSEAEMGQRVLPFICQHLLLVVKPDDLVADMHTAYERIQIDTTGFGVFIAGPSKTADIEQSLVIGAQGARSLTVFLER